jgi:hypothetical protein
MERGFRGEVKKDSAPYRLVRGAAWFQLGDD